MNTTRSNFVSVLAWMSIIGSGLTTVVALLQNVMLYLMFSGEPFAEIPADMPASAAFVFRNLHAVVLGFLLFSIAMLVVSIGLLKRKNWARWVFIVVLAVMLLWGLGSLVLPSMMIPTLPPVPGDSELRNMETMFSVMHGVVIVLGLGQAVLCGWLIKRLLSADVRQEFGR